MKTGLIKFFAEVSMYFLLVKLLVLSPLAYAATRSMTSYQYTEAVRRIFLNFSTLDEKTHFHKASKNNYLLKKSGLPVSLTWIFSRSLSGSGALPGTVAEEDMLSTWNRSESIGNNAAEVLLKSELVPWDRPQQEKTRLELTFGQGWNNRQRLKPPRSTRSAMMSVSDSTECHTIAPRLLSARRFWCLNGKVQGHQGSRQIPSGKIDQKDTSSSNQDSQQTGVAVGQGAIFMEPQQMASGGKAPGDVPPINPTHSRNSHCLLCKGVCKEKLPEDFAEEPVPRTIPELETVAADKKETEKYDFMDQGQSLAESSMDYNESQHQYLDEDILLDYESLDFEALLDEFLKIPVKDFRVAEKIKRFNHYRMVKIRAEDKTHGQEKQTAIAKLNMAVYCLQAGKEKEKEKARAKFLEAQSNAVEAGYDLSCFIKDWLVMYDFKKILEKIKRGEDVDKIKKSYLIGKLYQRIGLYSNPILCTLKAKDISEEGGGDVESRDQIESYELLHLILLFNFGLIPIPGFECIINYDTAFYILLLFRQKLDEQITPVSFTGFDKFKILGVSDDCLKEMAQVYKECSSIPTYACYYLPTIFVAMDDTVEIEKIYRFFNWLDYSYCRVLVNLINDFVALIVKFRKREQVRHLEERLYKKIKDCLKVFEGKVNDEANVKVICCIFYFMDATVTLSVNKKLKRLDFAKAGTALSKAAEYLPHNWSSALRCFQRAELYDRAASAAQQLSLFFGLQGNDLVARYWQEESDQIRSYGQPEITIDESFQNPITDTSRCLTSMELNDKPTSSSLSTEGKSKKKTRQKISNSHEQEVPFLPSTDDEKDSSIIKSLPEETLFLPRSDSHQLLPPAELHPDAPLYESSDWKVQGRKKSFPPSWKVLNQHYNPAVREALKQILKSRLEGNSENENKAFELLNNPESKNYIGIEHIWLEKARSMLRQFNCFFVSGGISESMRRKAVSTVKHARESYIWPALASYLGVDQPRQELDPEEVGNIVEKMLISPQYSAENVKTAVKKKLGNTFRGLGNSYSLEALASLAESETLNINAKKWLDLSRIEPLDAHQLVSRIPYNRLYFGYNYSQDGTCLNIRSSLLSKTAKSTPGDTNIQQYWVDPYTGQNVYKRHEMNVDHIVPLKWAWNHGADQWDYEKRRQFANDEINLVAVQAAVNKSKGDSSMLKWVPDSQSAKSWYVAQWQKIIKTYGLELSTKEQDQFDRKYYEIFGEDSDSPEKN